MTMNMMTDAAVVARHEAVHNAAAAGGEFLSFRLGGEEFGIDVLRVQEIRSYEQPTRIADAPGFIKGVVNLRGAIMPIVDLRLLLRCDIADYSALTVVVVLNVKGRVVGAVVDSVSDVLALPKEAIKPAPALGSAQDTGCITGIGSVKSGQGQRRLILMDIEALMASAGVELIVS
jgi:purine-binding chemotaxis protein CheW